MGISFPYFEMMLHGDRALLPKHALTLQEVVLRMIVEHQEREGHLTRAQFLALLENSEQMIETIIAWRQAGVLKDVDLKTVALLQDREVKLSRLIDQAIDKSAAIQRLQARFPEKSNPTLASEKTCACGCGGKLRGKQRYASSSCRKRASRKGEIGIRLIEV